MDLDFDIGVGSGSGDFDFELYDIGPLPLTPPPSGGLSPISLSREDMHTFGGVLDSPLITLRLDTTTTYPLSPPPTPRTPRLTLPPEPLLSPLSPEWLSHDEPESEAETTCSFLLGTSPDLDHDPPPAALPSLIDADADTTDLHRLLAIGRRAQADYAAESAKRDEGSKARRKRAKERGREVQALVALKLGSACQEQEQEKPRVRLGSPKLKLGGVKGVKTMAMLVARMVFRRREEACVCARAAGKSPLRKEHQDEDEDGLGLALGGFWE